MSVEYIPFPTSTCLPVPTQTHHNPTSLFPIEPILDVPTDIHILIIPLLAKPELANYSRISRAIHLLVIPYLYKSLVVDLSKPRTVPSFTLKPLVSQNLRVRRAFAGVRIAAAAGERAKKGGPRVASLPIPILLDPLPNPYLHTTHLTINGHTRNLCHNMTVPVLSNLETLCITREGAGFCTARPSADWKWRMRTNSTLCPFLAHLRPRRIVIQGLSMSTNCLDGLANAERPFPPEWVKEFVIPYRGNTHLLDTLPLSSLKRLVLLLDLAPGSLLPESPTSFQGFMCKHYQELLADACGRNTMPITIVGLETAGPETVALPAISLAEPVRAILKAGLLASRWGRRGNKEWTEESAAARIEEISFMEMAEYKGETE